MKSDLSNKLFGLKETSQRLNVSIETLIRWNEYNILKPTITLDGTIGYTEDQINHFLTIKQLVQADKNLPIQKDSEFDFSPTKTTNNPNYLQTSNFSQTNDLVVKNNSFSENGITKTDSLSFHEADFSHSISPKSSHLPLNITLTIIFLILSFAVYANISGLESKSILSLNDASQKVLGEKVSRLNSSDLPNDQSHQEKEKSLAVNSELKAIGENVIKERFKVNDMLFSKSQEVTSSATHNKFANNNASQKQMITALIKSEPNPNEKEEDNPYQNTYAFRGLNNADKNLVFDEGGKIKGEAKDTLATTLGEIGIIANTVPKQLNSGPMNGVSLLAIGLLSLVYLYPKSLAFTGKISQKPQSNLNNQPDNTQKIIEVDQKTDGTIVLYFEGKEYKISKPELHSESDQFIERIMGLVQHGIKKIEYVSSNDDDIDIQTPLSRLVTRLGFVGLKREMFFPRTAKDRVLFRKYITAKDLDNMKLTKAQILADLT